MLQITYVCKILIKILPAKKQNNDLVTKSLNVGCPSAVGTEGINP